MYDAIKTLESLLDDLPAEHHEKPGVIRAIEVLKDEHRSRQRTRVPVRPSAAGSYPEVSIEPKSVEQLSTLLAELESGIEQARGLDPASDLGWPLQVVDLRRNVKRLYVALQDETSSIEEEQRLALRERLDMATKTMLQEFFDLSDEAAEEMIHAQH